MKYLKYILGTIVILLLGFLAIGFISPTVTYESETVVDKPRAESWAVLQDPEKLPEWLSGFQKVESVSGIPGTVGAVSMVYFENDGQTMAIEETITDITPNESISMHYSSDFMDMDYTLSLATMDGKTRIQSTTTAKGNGIFSRSITALMGSALKEQEESNLSSLKKTIEQNSKNYSQAASE